MGLCGVLDVEGLRWSFEAVVHRHEALRTSIDAMDGEPRQRVAPPAPVPLPVEDPGENVTVAGAQWLAEENAPVSTLESLREVEVLHEAKVRVVAHCVEDTRPHDHAPSFRAGMTMDTWGLIDAQRGPEAGD